MSKELNPYFESFIVAFSSIVGLGISIYLINLILSPSLFVSNIILLGAVFAGIFGISLGYLKRFSSARIAERTNVASKKDTIPLILNTCIFTIFPFLYLYVSIKRIVSLKVITVLGILLIVYVCFFLRYLISVYRKIRE